MSPADRDARIREIKRLLKEEGGDLEACKRIARVAVYYGKPDRKRKAFRNYEERKHAYLKTKAEYDALRAELATLQALAREAQCSRCGQTWPRDPRLEVECPECHAPVGSRCKRPSGHTCVFHVSREQRAVDLGYLDAECPADRDNSGPRLPQPAPIGDELECLPLFGPANLHLAS